MLAPRSRAELDARLQVEPLNSDVSGGGGGWLVASTSRPTTRDASKGRRWEESYPAAAAASLLLLLLLLDELHGGGGGGGGPHGPHHPDAVLRERRQVQLLAPSHLHLLELLEPPQGELRRKDYASEEATGGGVALLSPW